ncbi:hypothetical protein ACVGVM_07980 [Pseudonocardia bannensis]|uniref:UDP-glucose/GDP-mannose dehydrogenase N-terminal domain-containing protein n=1 Tax=Pseudonocardia bannensis TaxID=630973 RepID=A0A848DCV2_9PSEU|nr:hypothetical protein [Pseudonocardia bannensis]NMH90426.1 hypothetical protein [Pseudonocardia bannensis]
MTGAARPRVVVVGRGRAGAASARRVALAGYDAVRFDPWGGRVEDLADRARSADGPRIVDDPARCAGFEVALLAVPTGPDRGPVRNALDTAVALLGPYMRPGVLVVLESPAAPGTTEQVVLPTLELVSGLRAGADFGLGYSVEISGDPPRLVAGVDAASRERVAGFYRSIGLGSLGVSGPRVAELVSLLQRDGREVDATVVDQLAVLAADNGVLIRTLVRALTGGGARAVDLMHPDEPPPAGRPVRGIVRWVASPRRAAACH